VPGFEVWFDDTPAGSAVRRPPPDEASDLEWLLYQQHGVLTTRQALTQMSRSRLRHLVATGRWQRVTRGVVVAHSASLDREQQLWVAVLCCGDGAVLAGLSAACAGGLRRAPGRTIDVLVPAGSRPLQPRRAALAATSFMPRVVAHRTSMLLDKDVLGRAAPPRTTMERSLVDAAQWANTDDQARAIVAAACQQRLTSPPDIFAVVERMTRARRRSVVLEAVGLLATGAAAVSEIHFAKLCRRFGLPEPDRQTMRRDRSGQLRYVDASWHDYGLHAEIDGGYHLNPEAYWADMMRQNDLWIGRERILRFPAWAIHRQPAAVARQLRAALIECGWRP
jgi:hypothetical protein